LPAERRSDFLTAVVAHLEIDEGDVANSREFERALSFALDELHSHRDVA
jgi:hypothetical protein